MSDERQILVAGLGNVFFGDDAFGVEVVRRLAAGPAAPGVRVVDFGIRGRDLAYALAEPWHAAILVDATPRGRRPGTLYVLEPTLPAGPAEVALDAHAMDPLRALLSARQLGGTVSTVRIVGCEPELIGTDEDLAPGLSPAVAAAIDPAVALVASLIADLREASGA